MAYHRALVFNEEYLFSKNENEVVKKSYETYGAKFGGFTEKECV